MTENAASTFEGLLSKFGAFRNLETDRLRWLAERARPFHCTVGQELLRRDRMPEFCFCIVEGRGRLLHDDPGLRRPVTLAYAHPGDLVVGLVWCAVPPVNGLLLQPFETHWLCVRRFPPARIRGRQLPNWLNHASSG